MRVKEEKNAIGALVFALVAAKIGSWIEVAIWGGYKLIPPLEFRPTVIPYIWVVSLMFNDQLNLFSIDLCNGSRFRFKKNFFSNSKIASLFSAEVLFNKLALGAAKVVKRIGQVLAYVYFSVRIGDFVDYFVHAPGSYVQFFPSQN